MNLLLFGVCLSLCIGDIQGFFGILSFGGFGSCPMTPAHKPQCKNTDDDCIGDQDCARRDDSCCYDGCKKICIEKGLAILSSGDGPCPHSPNRPDCATATTNLRKCDSDSACNSGQVCCFDGCVYTCIRPKAGWVPTTTKQPVEGGQGGIPGPSEHCTNVPQRTDCTSVTDLNKCNADSDCEAGQVCCFDGCCKVCTPGPDSITSPPTDEETDGEIDTSHLNKDGTCPQNIGCDPGETNQCYFDLQCGSFNDQKCCDATCGIKKCVQRVEGPCVNDMDVKMTFKKVRVRIDGKLKIKTCENCNCDQLTQKGDEFMKKICTAKKRKRKAQKYCCLYCNIFTHMQS